MHRFDEQDLQWVKNTLMALEQQDYENFMKLLSSYSVPEILQPYKLHLTGLGAIRVGNFAEALSFFKQASEMNDEAKIHFEACGFCAASLGMLSDSLFYLKMSSTCLESSDFDLMFWPDWVGSVEDKLLNIEERPYFAKANESYRAGNFTGAIENLQQALNADPFNVESWLLIYYSMLAVGRDYDAIQAIHAAIDSGEVEATVLAEAAVYAMGLGLVDDSKIFLDKAFDRADAILLPLIEAMNVSRLKLDPNKPDDYKRQSLIWGSSYIDKEEPTEKLPYLSQRVKIGIYSAHFSKGGGNDAIVNFIIELATQKIFPWLKVVIYSHSKFSDVNTRRLASNVKDFKNVDDIDSKTLSRIMKNDALHFLWDLDGFDFGGKPDIHNVVSIPFRWVNGFGGEKFRFDKLTKVGTDTFDTAPYFLPQNLIVKGRKAHQIKGEPVKIALSLLPVEITDEFLDIFIQLKVLGVPFKLMLDTVKLGGISMVDIVMERFNAVGLKRSIEFVDPSLGGDEYQKYLYSNSDYAVAIDGHSAAQAIYASILWGCRILVLRKKDGVLGRGASLMQHFGLNNFIFDETIKLAQIIRTETSDEKLYLAASEIQCMKVSVMHSAEFRAKCIIAFAEKLKGKIVELYGFDTKLFGAGGAKT